MGIQFGPAGNSESFYEQGFKSSLEMPKWLNEMGLDAYEYSCGRGVKISDDSAEILGDEAKKWGIRLSVHSPYYSNLATPDPERQEKSIGYIMQAVHAASKMKADRVVVHMGGAGKLTRAEGIVLSKALLHRTLMKMDDEGYGHITLCIETMGKVNQLGTVAETLDVCSIDSRLLPVFDFGHINSREQGSLKTTQDYAAVLDAAEKKLGQDRAKAMHIHFSKIEYTHMGEKRHLTFADREYGPEFEPLGEVLYKRNYSPVVICESAGTMAEDALYMKQAYQKIKAELG